MFFYLNHTTINTIILERGFFVQYKLLQKDIENNAE